MPFFSFSLVFLLAISAYASIHFLAFYRHGYRRNNPNIQYLLLSLMSLMATVFLAGEIMLYYSPDPISYALAFKWRLVFGISYIIIWPWFIFSYTGIGPKWLVTTISGYMGLHLLINLIRPYGSLFDELPTLTTKALPWGESITWHEHQVSTVYSLGWLGVFLIIFYTYYACYQQYRLSKRTSAAFVFVSNFLFTLLVIENLFVITQELDAVLMAQYGFPLFIILMGIRMHYETYEESERINDIINYMPAQISIKSLEGNLLMSNKLHQELAHFVNDESEHEIQNKLCLKQDLKAINSNQSIEYEFDLTHPDNTNHSYRSIVFPLLDLDKRPYAICNIATDTTEHLRAQKQIEQSEIKYRSLFESAGDAILVLDEETIIDCNMNALQLFGATRNDLIGNSPITLSPSTQYDELDSRKAAKEKLNEALMGDNITFTWLHKRLDGSTFDAEVSLSPIEINGKSCLQGIIRDITYKKRVNDAIKDIATGVCATTSDNFFKQLVINLTKLFKTQFAFIGLIDEDNPNQINTLAVCQGNEIIENISYSLSDTPCGNVVTSGACFYPNNVQKQFPKDHLLEAMNVEGYVGTPLIGKSGDVLGLIVLLHNNELTLPIWKTEIMQIFAARAGAELERIRAEKGLYIKDRAMEAAQEGILLFETSPSNLIIYSNISATKITGYKIEELLGATIESFFGEKTLASVKSDINTAISESLPFKDDVQFYKKNHDVYWAEITLTPVSGELKHIDHFIMTIQDITERRATEDAFRHSQKMEAVGQLAAGLSHDFNNKLGVILGYTEAMLLTSSLDKKNKKWLKIIESATNSCASLTRQLLTFSRHQTNEAKIADLNSKILEMKALLTRSLTPTVNISFNLQADLWPVLLEPNSFQDVLLNLAINARDAMPDGGDIFIETMNRNISENDTNFPAGINGKYVEISIRDTGEGMDKKTRERIFEPFFTTKPEEKGTGLGLAMVYAYIKRFNGDIDVQSKVGEGTSFNLYFPIADDDVELVSIEQATDDLPRGSETVLVVDDEYELCMLIEASLNSLGYDVMVANSAKNAVELMQQNPRIKALITDIIMPGDMTGNQLALQAKSINPAIKILLMTAYLPNVDTDIHKLLKTDVIEKPFKMSDLSFKLREIIEKD